jgi:hypothetical protein
MVELLPDTRNFQPSLADTPDPQVCVTAWTDRKLFVIVVTVPGPILYSTNPWFATDIANRYRGGVYFAWVCEYFDIVTAPAGSAAAKIAPSSNPARIYRNLSEECAGEEGHSPVIKNYKKTFTRLAKEWLAKGDIDKTQFDEIIANIRATSWKTWKPVLYVIPRAPIEAGGRLISVRRPDRGAYGPELQIIDLLRDEFDIIEIGT